MSNFKIKAQWISTRALHGIERYSHCGISCVVFFAICSIFFIVWPQFDILVSSIFYDGFGYFPLNENWIVKMIYEGVPWFGRFIFLISLFVIFLAIVAPALISRRYWRRAASMAVVVVLGIGLLVHAVLKDGMGRPRPKDVEIFAGSTSFVPVFKPSQFCATNCSFVSGHAAVGFSLMSLGMLGVRRRRNFWFVMGVITGCLIGFVRVVQGGHFLSDVIFSFCSIWAIHLLIRYVWIRFRFWQLFQNKNLVSRFKAVH